MSWLPKKTVLVPTDFSEPSADAVHTALELVECGADVHVLHVLQPIEHNAPEVLFGDLDDDTRRDKAGQFLADFLKRHGINGVTRIIRIGDPGLAVAEYAAENNADLIVIPSHGHHGLRRILLGSVAERIIRHAECPTLILRRKDHD
ncbi:universal stress protein [bacterium]|nr:universal stress protein [bacterium]